MPHLAYSGPIALCSALRTLDLARSYNPHLPAAPSALGGEPGVAVGYHVGGCRQLIHWNGVGFAYFLLDDPNGLSAYEKQLPHLF